MKIIALVLLFIPSILLSQEKNESNLDKIIRGGELLVNIINLGVKKDKSEKSERCKTEKIESICINNATPYRLKIFLFPEGSSREDGSSLISTSSAQVCNYTLEEGVYNYVVQNVEDGDIYIKSQLKLERCEELELQIKF